MTAAAIVAIVAAVVAAGAAAAAFAALRKTRAHERALEREIERGKAMFDEVVTREARLRAEELEQTLAMIRSEAISKYAAEERRIAEERRQVAAEIERTATTAMTEALTAVQRKVEQRITDWSADVDKLQEGLSNELVKIGAQQRQAIKDLEAKIAEEDTRLQGTIDRSREQIAKLRGELERQADALAKAGAADLENHAAERRAALTDVGERLRRREEEITAQIEREQAEATQRVTATLSDVEHRQVEQLRRVVQHEAARFSEAAAQQFELVIRAEREEAARRLSRELDLAVERFAREAEGDLAERVEQLAQSAVSRVETKLSTIDAGFERARNDATAAMARRTAEAEADLRGRLEAVAREAEAARSAIENRLHDLARRFDDLAART